MEQEPAGDAEALRRRLYRPGASPADLADYLQVAEAERPDAPADAAPAPAPTGPSLRPFAVGGAVVAAAALLGAVLLTGGSPSPAAPTALAAPTVAAPTAVATQEADGSWQVGFVAAGVLDGGATVHATGRAQQDGPDMYRYVVASGDTAAAIAGRFGLCEADVLQTLPYGFDPGRLPAGSTLELLHDDGNTC